MADAQTNTRGAGVRFAIACTRRWVPSTRLSRISALRRAVHRTAIGEPARCTIASAPPVSVRPRDRAITPSPLDRRARASAPPISPLAPVTATFNASFPGKLEAPPQVPRGVGAVRRVGLADLRHLLRRRQLPHPAQFLHRLLHAEVEFRKDVGPAEL